MGERIPLRDEHWVYIGLFANKAWYEQLANKLWLTRKTTIQIRSTSTIRALISGFRPTLQNISPGSSQNMVEQIWKVSTCYLKPPPSITHPSPSRVYQLRTALLLNDFLTEFTEFTSRRTKVATGRYVEANPCPILIAVVSPMKHHETTSGWSVWRVDSTIFHPE